jgi:hypothetical protein
MTLTSKTQHLISKNSFFDFFYKKRYDFFSFFLNVFHYNIVPGSYVYVFISHNALPFIFSVFLKSGGINFFINFIKFEVIDGICIGVYRKYNGSSLILRFFIEKFMVEKSILIFSPIYINFIQADVPKSHKFSFKHLKSKLFFLAGYSHKSFLRHLYFMR